LVWLTNYSLLLLIFFQIFYRYTFVWNIVVFRINRVWWFHFRLYAVRFTLIFCNYTK
jgi:hypothetical protein